MQRTFMREVARSAGGAFSSRQKPDGSAHRGSTRIGDGADEPQDSDKASANSSLTALGSALPPVARIT